MTELEKPVAATKLVPHSARFLRMQEAADLAAVSLAHLRRAIQTGRGPRVTALGRRARRISVADLTEWLEALPKDTPAAAATSNPTD